MKDIGQEFLERLQRGTAKVRTYKCKGRGCTADGLLKLADPERGLCAECVETEEREAKLRRSSQANRTAPLTDLLLQDKQADRKDING